jgi:D-lactate dehydrogenase
MERAARAALRAGHAIAAVTGDGPVRALSHGARRLLGDELVPEWGPALPPAARPPPRTSRVGAAAVYFPACINRILGPSADAGPGVVAATVEVSRRAGMPVWIPPDVRGRCCATPWSSKGYRRGHRWMANEIVDAVWRWSDGGALPIVVDAASCTHGIAREVGGSLDAANAERHLSLQVLDSVEWCHRLLERLEPSRVGSIAVHPTCSARQLGLTRRLVELGERFADEVHQPPSAQCCGFAGDRGLLHPELTEAATLEEAAELAGRDFDAYLCGNRTCEVALERASGRAYRSPVELVERLTRP